MRQHVLRIILLNTARIVQVHVATIILMNRRLPALNLISMTVATRCVVHVIGHVVFAREILLRCIVGEASLLDLLGLPVTTRRWSARAQRLGLTAVLVRLLLLRRSLSAVS